MSKHTKERASAAMSGTNQKHGMSRRAWVGVALGGATLTFVGERWWRSATAAPANPSVTPMTVYASPACSCCGAWIRHVEAAGFRVTRESAPDVTPFKRKYAIPQDLWSCHTARVEGYTIEGHVPADLIQKLLDDRALVAGLAVAGMPNGAPGMEGARKDSYEVRAFTQAGDTNVYAIR